MKWLSQLLQQGRGSIFVARLILHKRSLRRSVMFWGTLTSLGLAFFGAFLIMDALMEAPLLFACYWLGVVLLVLFLLLLALYDMLVVPREIREEAKQELLRSLPEETHDAGSDRDPPPS